jgi:hypothetical protein
MQAFIASLSALSKRSLAWLKWMVAWWRHASGLAAPFRRKFAAVATF